ncbi:MAG: tetratricopeptide repeat protein, partial [Spirochaetales bacterium]|nr:tetratricopeptide repeat protein [Spirochaetales bacterium]
PSVNLGVGARYIQGQSSAGTVYQTVGVSLGLGYNFRSGTKGAEIHYDINTLEIYPLYYTWYDENSLGTVEIINRDSEKIKNIRAGFYVPQYMEQPKYSDQTITAVKKGGSAVINLLGLFTNDIFEINEGLKVAAEVIVDYEYYGREYSESIPLTVQINNKNAMTWDDDRKAACFVTANNPLVYSYSRSLSGKIRSEAVAALDKNFQIAMGLFEALGLYGLGYVVDPSSAYAELSENTQTVDYIQFPQQTLISQAGDCDDLSVLYASMLEASGIPSAFITIPGHIYVAFQLGLDETQARRKFPSSKDLIFIDDQAWLPVEVTLVGDGFLPSWQTGARQIRDNNGEYGFFPVREAWDVYPPAEYETSGIAYLPNPEDVLEQHRRVLSRFLKQEINTQVAAINDEIAEKGASHILYNKMGVAYARYGFLDDAREWFEKSVAMKEFYPGYINLGNVYYLQKNADAASRSYERALDLKPDSEKALVGLALVSSELEDYNTANSALATLASVNPEAARDMAHLGTGSGVRASSAQNREVDEWSE